MKTVRLSLLVPAEYIRILQTLGYSIEYTLDESVAATIRRVSRASTRLT